MNKAVKIILGTIAIAELLVWIAGQVDGSDCVFLWFIGTTILAGLHIFHISISESNEQQYKHEIEMCSKAKKKLEIAILKKRRMSSKN